MTTINSDEIRDKRAYAEGVVTCWLMSENFEDFKNALDGRFEGMELELYFALANAYWNGQRNCEYE